MTKKTARKGKTAKKATTKRKAAPKPARFAVQIDPAKPADLVDLNKLESRIAALEAMHPLASVFEMDGHDDSDHEHVQDFAIGIPGKSYPRPFQSMPTKLAVDIAKLTDTAAAFNDRIAALEAAVKEVRPWTAKDEARCPTPVPNPEPVPVDVAALCKRHGLKLDEFGWWRGPTDSRHGPDDERRWWCLRVNPNGYWKYGAPHVLSQRTGGPTELAAALERYCPVEDAPYGEAERRADAIAAGWVECLPWKGMFSTVPSSIRDCRYAGALVDNGRVSDAGSSEWRDTTPAEFRAHLAKYAVKREPVSDVPAKGQIEWKQSDTGLWLQPVMHRDGRLGWAAPMAIEYAFESNVKRPDGMPDEMWQNKDFKPHVLGAKEPPREPDATPEERRAEMERRGLKEWRGTGRFCRDGTGECPCAWVDGRVIANDAGYTVTSTRTMPEFCAALDAVGLVAKGDPVKLATPEERAALCEAWGPDGAAAGGMYSFKLADGLRMEVWVVHGTWKVMDGPKFVSGGGKVSVEQLLAVFREHLPYDREWREKVVREAGWYDHGPKPSGHLWSIRNNVNCAVFVLPDRGEVAIGCDSITPLPDRAAWLKFIRDNTPAKPPLVGDGPWTVEQLNKAGVECEAVQRRHPMVLILKYGKDGDGDDNDMLSCQTTVTRAYLLWLAAYPDVNPEWAAKVKAALGENNA